MISFAASPLYFLPHNQAACRFRYFGRQRLKRQETEVVGFAQVPERDLPMTALLRLGDTTAQTLAQGLAWIDATSHEVLRIQTDLLAPRPDLRLEEETAEIDFSAIRLPERSSTFWLPTRVIVEVTYSHRHFRTIHEYADFKLFQVESRIGPHPKTEKSGFRG